MNGVVRVAIMLSLLILSSAVLYVMPYVLNRLKGWKSGAAMTLIIVACSGCLIGFVEIGEPISSSVDTAVISSFDNVR